MRLLILEDDRQLGDALATGLRQLGHAVDWFADGAQADSAIDTAPYDAVVLDLGLPRTDGMVWLRRWRERGSTVPVLILTAREGVQQRIDGLDAGADDYLIKPFSIAELLARIRVALRHRGSALQPALKHFEGDGLRVDLEARVVERDGDPVHLTPTEFNLLARLLRGAGRIVTHRQLLADVWGTEHVEDTHYLRLYMGQLRAKLERAPSEPRFLRTEIGVGYRFAVE